MKFTKMHGIGNDYVYVNCFEEHLDDPAKEILAVSGKGCGRGKRPAFRNRLGRADPD